MELLSAQYLTAAQQLAHPAHRIVNLPAGPRRMTETLMSKVGHLVEPHLENGVIPPGAYKSSIDKIHTKVVQEAKSKCGNNRVLGTPAPKINSTEASLCRPTRAVLAQLRSGHCSRLLDFQLKIGKVANDSCPECRLFSNSVDHIFNCPAHPTNLSPEDLWHQPREVASHLSSFPAFSHLPAIAPLPPRQGRRRRPPPEPPPTST